MKYPNSKRLKVKVIEQLEGFAVVESKQGFWYKVKTDLIVKSCVSPHNMNTGNCLGYNGRDS